MNGCPHSRRHDASPSTCTLCARVDVPRVSRIARLVVPENSNEAEAIVARARAANPRREKSR